MKRIRIKYKNKDEEQIKIIEGVKITDTEVISLLSTIEKNNEIIDIIVLEMQKTCNKCGESYIDIKDNFYPMKSGIDGYMAICKHCYNKGRRKVKSKGDIKEKEEIRKEKLKKYNKEYYQKNKDKIYSRRKIQKENNES